METSFQQRRVKVTFKLATGSFNKDGEPDTVVLEDFRSRINISAPGGYEYSECHASIFGIEKDTMDRLSVFNYQNLEFMRNTIMIEATDFNGEYVVIFYGTIIEAYPDYTSTPDVPFIAKARAGLIDSLAPAVASSFPGARKVSEIMAVLASSINLKLENNGVDTTLTDQYLGGTPMDKIQKVASAAGIQYWYLPAEGVLAIAPMGKPRETYPPVKYNSGTGLIGWPKKEHVGISFSSLFRPQVAHGCKIIMDSDVPNCNGEWFVIRLDHQLDAMTPGGAWFSRIVSTPTNVFIKTR